MDLKNTFGAVVISGAAMATFNSALTDEPDVIADLINANGAFQNAATDVIHEPISNPLENNGIYIDFNNDVADIINALKEDGPDLLSGNFVSFTNIPQTNLPYAAAKKFNEEFLQNGSMVLEEADYVPSKMRPILEQANLERAQNFLYVSDQETQREEDHWGIGEIVDDVNPERKKLFAGDCDDYSLRGLVKNNEELGISLSAMTMVTMETKDPDNRQGHAMLMVRFDDGDAFYDMNGAVYSLADVTKEYDLKYAMSLSDKGYLQKVSPTEFGVEATMDEVPQYADVPLPIPRPKGQGMDI